jgi:hypothetical protein
MHQLVFVYDHPESIYIHFSIFLAISRPFQTFPDKNFKIILAQLFSLSYVSSMHQSVFVTIFQIFFAFLASLTSHYLFKTGLDIVQSEKKCFRPRMITEII